MHSKFKDVLLQKCIIKIEKLISIPRIKFSFITDSSCAKQCRVMVKIKK